MDMDKANESIRRWISELTGKTGDDLDILLREGAVYGALAEKEEIISRTAIITASKIITLTPAELLVLDLAANGMTIKETAIRLNISEHTIKQQLTCGRRRLGAKNTAHAVRLAIRTGQMSA